MTVHINRWSKVQKSIINSQNGSINHYCKTMNIVSNKVIMLQRMFKILNKYDFKIERSNSDEYKCEICKRILCNACQGECGCRYCSKCFADLLNSESKFCPGNSELCKDLQLAENNIQIDHRMNNELLKMVVKCPNKLCSFETELKDMDKHLRVCSSKVDKCPFHQFGCGHDKVKCSKMDEYLKDEIFSHSKILIEVISNIKNDTSELWNMKIKYENDLKTIQNELVENREQIQILRQEVIKLKSENSALSESVSYLTTKVKNKVQSNSSESDSIRLSDKSFIDDKKLLENLLKIYYENPRNEIDDTKTKCELNTSIETSNYKIIANISWDIERLSERKKKNNWAKSNFFYAYGDQHKLNLTFWANGYEKSVGNCATIFFRVISSQKDSSLTWPFITKIKIRLTNNYSLESSLELEKLCDLKMPNSNSFICSDPFDFSYNELFTLGLLTHDCLRIECFVYDE